MATVLDSTNLYHNLAKATINLSAGPQQQLPNWSLCLHFCLCTHSTLWSYHVTPPALWKLPILNRIQNQQGLQDSMICGPCLLSDLMNYLSFLHSLHSRHYSNLLFPIILELCFNLSNSEVAGPLALKTLCPPIFKWLDLYHPLGLSSNLTSQWSFLNNPI